MSDLKDRVGVMTGGNADLIPNAGDLITGDGNQTVYLRNPNVDGASDGFVLTLDSTAEEGISWQAGGGGGGISNVTGADGITVTTPSGGVRQVHNSLVTGAAVAQVDAETVGSVNIVAGTGAGGGGLNVGIVNDSGPGLSIGSNKGTGAGNGDITINSDNATGTVTVDGGTVTLNGQNALNLSPHNGANITLTTGTTGDVVINSSRNETHDVIGDITITNDTSGAQLSMTAAGDVVLSQGSQQLHIDSSGNVTLQSSVNLDLKATGVTASATLEATGGGPVTIRSQAPGAITIQPVGPGNGAVNIGSVGTADVTIDTGGGNVSIQPSNNNFQIFGGAGGPQAANVALPTGGSVVDAEARAAIVSLINDLILWGFIAPAP